MVLLESTDVEIPLFLNEEKLQKELLKLTDNEKQSLGEITVIFCSDEYLLKINQEYLKHDYYTDIITFDYSETSVVSGDLFISIERIKENAETEKTTFECEINRVIIHGVLHLCGYKDKSKEEEKLMREKENFYLSQIGFT